MWRAWGKGRRGGLNLTLPSTYLVSWRASGGTGPELEPAEIYLAYEEREMAEWVERLGREWSGAGRRGWGGGGRRRGRSFLSRRNGGKCSETRNAGAQVEMGAAVPLS